MAGFCHFSSSPGSGYSKKLNKQRVRWAAGIQPLQSFDCGRRTHAISHLPVTDLQPIQCQRTDGKREHQRQEGRGVQGYRD